MSFSVNLMRCVCVLEWIFRLIRWYMFLLKEDFFVKDREVWDLRVVCCVVWDLLFFCVVCVYGVVGVDLLILVILKDIYGVFFLS